MSKIHIKRKDNIYEVLVNGEDITKHLCITDIQINVDVNKAEAIFTVPIMGDMEIDEADILIKKKKVTETSKEVGNRTIKTTLTAETAPIEYKIKLNSRD